MIVKAYSDTHYLQAIKNLSYRLSSTNPKRQELEFEYNRIKAGDTGEKFVMEKLAQLQLPYDFYLFHNLFLNLGSKMQIDILFLTKYYAIIFEIKNIKGKIEFTKNPDQLMRTLPNGDIDGFDSPELQLKEYIYELKSFFLKQGMNIPVSGAIIFPFSSSFIMRPPTDTKVLRKNGIKAFIREMETNKVFLNNNQIEFLKKRFLRNHLEYNPYPLMNRYNISKESIIKGVLCPKCGVYGMQRSAYYWYCKSCQHKSKNAHENAIKDYLTIISDSVTNKECRDFLNVQDIDQMTKMLRKMNLKKVGKFRYTKYMLN
ncbi:nuclease-related domain-containing protein [Rummeliibacillus sp. JY-2-4R]